MQVYPSSHYSQYEFIIIIQNYTAFSIIFADTTIVLYCYQVMELVTHIGTFAVKKLKFTKAQ